MDRITFQAKDGWLRVKFVLTVEDGKVKEVDYTAARCKTLRSLSERVKEALVGTDVDRIGERVREVMAGVQLPENRENRRRLILKAFGLEDG